MANTSTTKIVRGPASWFASEPHARIAPNVIVEANKEKDVMADAKASGGSGLKPWMKTGLWIVGGYVALFHVAIPEICNTTGRLCHLVPPAQESRSPASSAVLRHDGRGAVAQPQRAT